MSLRRFIHNNLVVVVMVPTIIAVHWGCNKIQNIDAFVSEAERKDLPIVQVVKYLKNGTMETISGFLDGKK